MKNIKVVVACLLSLLLIVVLFFLLKEDAKFQAKRAACIETCDVYPFVYIQGGKCVCDLNKVRL